MRSDEYSIADVKKEDCMYVWDTKVGSNVEIDK